MDSANEARWCLASIGQEDDGIHFALISIGLCKTTFYLVAHNHHGGQAHAAESLEFHSRQGAQSNPLTAILFQRMGRR